MVVCECGQDTDERVIGCDKCDCWYHYSCAHLSASEVDKIIHYYCDKCVASEDAQGRVLRNTWKRDKPTNAERDLKKREFHDVRKIVGHRERSGKRQFKILWEGYSDRYATWEPEEHLIGCVDMLQHYCRTVQPPLQYSKIRYIYGASGDRSSTNRDNWASLEEIATCFNKIKQRIFAHVPIEIKLSEEFGSADSLHFIGYDQHCYVVLYLYSSGFGYIADGSNLYRDDIKSGREIRDLLKIPLVSCSFEKQTKIDHCASSAVLIGLEFTRNYHHKIRPRTLVPPKRLSARVIEQMHPFESVKLDAPPLSKRKQQLACPHCGRTFWKSARKNYLLHCRHCSGKVIKS